VSVLVLALYVNLPEIEGLYRHPKTIWALCGFMLFWISRVWMTAQRGGCMMIPLFSRWGMGWVLESGALLYWLWSSRF